MGSLCTHSALGFEKRSDPESMIITLSRGQHALLEPKGRGGGAKGPVSPFCHGGGGWPFTFRYLLILFVSSKMVT